MGIDKNVKIGIGAAGLLAGGIAISKSLRANSFINSLVIGVSPKVKSIEKYKINIETTVKIDNPKALGLEMQKPTIRIYSENDKLITKSDPTDEKITIGKTGITELDYDFKVGVFDPVVIGIISNAGQTVPALIAQFASGQPVSLGINLKVKVFLKIGNIEKSIEVPVTV